MEQQDYAGAIDVIEELRASALDPDELNSLWSAAHLGLGYRLLAAGELSAAREAFAEGKHLFGIGNTTSIYSRR